MIGDNPLHNLRFPPVNKYEKQVYNYEIYYELAHDNINKLGKNN